MCCLWRRPLTQRMPKHRKKQPKCANCKGPHVANYKGCQAYKKQVLHQLVEEWSTILQIYKQCVTPVFEYGSLSNITASDTIISKIQWLRNKFIQLALHLPKYISVKLLHDSSGLPYVKDRLPSYATKTLERISKHPLVEESISFHRVNPNWNCFPTPLSMIRPLSL